MGGPFLSRLGFAGGVGLEPCGLFGGELGGGFAEVADGFEGELAGDGVGVVVGEGVEGRQSSGRWRSRILGRALRRSAWRGP